MGYMHFQKALKNEIFTMTEQTTIKTATDYERESVKYSLTVCMYICTKLYLWQISFQHISYERKEEKCFQYY